MLDEIVVDAAITDDEQDEGPVRLPSVEHGLRQARGGARRPGDLGEGAGDARRPSRFGRRFDRAFDGFARRRGGRRAGGGGAGDADRRRGFAA